MYWSLDLWSWGEGRPGGRGVVQGRGARADGEAGADLTARLGLAEAVRRAVPDSSERFGGRGVPAGRAGAEVAGASRFAAVGYAAVMFGAAGVRERPGPLRAEEREQVRLHPYHAGRVLARSAVPACWG
jgi:hypothetical protein